MQIIWYAVIVGFCLAIDACEKPQQPAADESQPESRANPAIKFELQERCAKLALEQFKRLGWDKEETAGFTNHYNEKMNKCVLLIQNTAKNSPGIIGTNMVLVDAFEGKELGTYSWHTVRDKGISGPAIQCEVTLPSGEKKFCNSQAEFDELIKIYVE
jgi:hypothetical protein